MNSLKKLRSDAMRGDWSEVLKTYKRESVLRTEKITATGDTLLHMAVSSGEEDVVEKMVDLLVDEEKKRAPNNVVVTVEGGIEVSQNVNIVLRAENDRKNTPLHLAAIRGNVKMCKKIGNIDPSLIARRNIMGETPLFLTALSGHERAFLWLHYLYGASSTDFAHCVRNNHDTILHCAIAQEHIGVAIEIIHLYKHHMKEMMKCNEEGLSPLHLLAAKRSPFKSTGLFGLSNPFSPIYWFFRVKEKKQATTLEELQHYCPVRVQMEAILVKHIQKIKNLETFLVIKFICWLPLVFLLLLQLPFSRAGRWFHQKRKMKQKHTWSPLIVKALLDHASDSESMATPGFGTITVETPLVIATKNGVIEMVEKILESFPSKIKDVNAEGKNIFLLAAEYRQTEVFIFLCKQAWLKESDVFRQVDKEGNNALHLAARLGIEPDWLNLGEALSTSREIAWFNFVKRSMPHDLLERYNSKMKTPEDIFRETYKELIKSEAEWVGKTSQACSVVSTLVASVAFATSTNPPGGYDNNGHAILRNKSAFQYFSGSSFLALLFSLISTFCFLSLVAYPSKSVNSWRYVPVKLVSGTYFMFLSIVCLWISFCAGNFFMLDDKSLKLRHVLPSYYYVVFSLGIILYVAAQLHTFLGPLLSSISVFLPLDARTFVPLSTERTKNKEKGTDLNRQR